MSEMKDWSAQTYLRFEDERTRPSRDLLAQVPLTRAVKIVDLGCGPGNSTELLVAHYPDAEVIGLDASPDMLAAARKRLPQCRFVEGDIATWTPEPDVDLVFANAVFQWVPDHLGALVRIFEALPKGGVLAVQVPDNQGEPSHVTMRETAATGPWASRFAEPVRREVILPPRTYFEALGPDAARLDIWHTIYQHPLACPEAIVDWVMGSGLRPFLDRLDPADRPAFLAAYSTEIAGAYPPLSDGRVLLRFPRLFIVAARGE